jgi:GH24 family phage-related lysozyme (muramidase)
MLTDSELDQTCEVLIKHEGLIPWLYCCTKGFVTVGVGDKVSPKTVLTMPFVHLLDGSHAMTEEKSQAFIRVQNHFAKGLTAGDYRVCSDLRLDEEFCNRRLRSRIKSEFVPAIEKHCPLFANYPTRVKFVLVDIVYNVGVVGFAAFDQLIIDCNSLQFSKAAEQVHTQKEGEDPRDPKTWGRRNTWRRNTMLLAHSAQVTLTANSIDRLSIAQATKGNR